MEIGLEVVNWKTKAARKMARTPFMVGDVIKQTDDVMLFSGKYRRRVRKPDLLVVADG